MFTKHAYFDSHILDIKGAPSQRTASLDTLSDFDNYRTDQNYMYVRIRAISSRVNRNFDGWPTTELAGSLDVLNKHKHSADGFTVEAKDGSKSRGFATFVGKPIFVDHNNTNPDRGRGVIVDSKFRVLDQRTAAADDYWKSSDVDPEHLPASEIELLLEIDSKEYPKFAKAIRDGELDGFSMGANVEYTKCSHCGNEAHDPSEFCSHVLMKGANHDFKTADGKRVSKASYENCYGCGFFEISGVFDPADETALAREVRSSTHAAEVVAPNPNAARLPVKEKDPIQDHADWLSKEYGYDPQTALEHAVRKTTASFKDPFIREAQNPLPQSMMTTAPDEVDTLRQEQICPVCGNDMDSEQCDVCGYTAPPKEFDNPDLSKAQQVRDEMKADDDQESQQQTPAPDPTQGSPAGAAGPTPPPSTPGAPSKPPVAAPLSHH